MYPALNKCVCVSCFTCFNTPKSIDEFLKNKNNKKHVQPDRVHVHQLFSLEKL